MVQSEFEKSSDLIGGWEDYPYSLDSYDPVFESASRCVEILNKPARGFTEEYLANSKVTVMDWMNGDFWLQEDANDQLLDEILQKTPSVRIIFVRAAPQRNSKLWTMSLSSCMTKKLLTRYHWPAQAVSYIRSPARQNFGSRILFHGATDEAQPTREKPRFVDTWYRLSAPVIVKPNTPDVEWLHLSVCMHYDVNEQSTTIIVKSTYRDEVSPVAEKLLHAVANSLKTPGEAVLDPFAFHLRQMFLFADIWREAIDKMYWDEKIHHMTTAGSGALLSLDIETLHKQREVLESYKNHLGVQLDVVQCLREAHTRFLTSIDPRPRNAIHKRVQAHLKQLEDQSKYLISSAGGSDRRVQNFMTLHFSLVAQEDSRATGNMAKITLQDGLSMKTVAILTMFFLPGTFVSAILGMNFFSFSPDSPDRGFVISQQWWIYLAFTVPLTAITFLGWLFWMRRAEKRMKDEERAFYSR